MSFVTISMGKIELAGTKELGKPGNRRLERAFNYLLILGTSFFLQSCAGTINKAKKEPLISKKAVSVRFDRREALDYLRSLKLSHPERELADSFLDSVGTYAQEINLRKGPFFDVHDHYFPGVIPQVSVKLKNMPSEFGMVESFGIDWLKKQNRFFEDKILLDPEIAGHFIEEILHTEYSPRAIYYHEFFHHVRLNIFSLKKNMYLGRKYNFLDESTVRFLTAKTMRGYDSSYGDRQGGDMFVFSLDWLLGENSCKDIGLSNIDELKRVLQMSLKISKGDKRVDTLLKGRASAEDGHYQIFLKMSQLLDLCREVDSDIPSRLVEVYSAVNPHDIIRYDHGYLILRDDWIKQGRWSTMGVSVRSPNGKEYYILYRKQESIKSFPRSVQDYIYQYIVREEYP